MRDARPAQWTTAKNLTLSLSPLQGRGTSLSCYFQPSNFRFLLPDKPGHILSPRVILDSLTSLIKLIPASSSLWWDFSVPLNDKNLTALSTLLFCSEGDALAIPSERVQGGTVHKSSSDTPKGLCECLQCSWCSTPLCMHSSIICWMSAWCQAPSQALSKQWHVKQKHQVYKWPYQTPEA